MTRLQRIGLAALLLVVIILQASMIDVLRFFTPIHLPIASVIMFWIATIGGGLALILGKE